MEEYILITTLNDFIFCPRSVYYKQFYNERDAFTFQGKAQISGKLAHEKIDNNEYSDLSDILQGVYVYSDKYNLLGKIDIYNRKTGELTERKKTITTVYDGYIFQLYAQYFCLVEMGEKVKSLSLYSFSDNKKYPVKLPSEDTVMFGKFEKLIDDISEYNLSKDIEANENKCRNCIYNPICDVSKC